MGSKRWRAMSGPVLPMVMRSLLLIWIDHHRRLEILWRGLINLDRPGRDRRINARGKYRGPMGAAAGVVPEQTAEAQEENPPYSRAAPLAPCAWPLRFAGRLRSQVPTASPAESGGRGNDLVATGANMGAEHQEYYSIRGGTILSVTVAASLAGRAPGKPVR
jgi:hypothetical protein